jgi:hypothetical protein
MSILYCGLKVVILSSGIEGGKRDFGVFPKFTIFWWNVAGMPIFGFLAA